MRGGSVVEQGPDALPLMRRIHVEPCDVVYFEMVGISSGHEHSDEFALHFCDKTADIWSIQSPQPSLPVECEVIELRANCIGGKMNAQAKRAVRRCTAATAGQASTRAWRIDTSMGFILTTDGHARSRRTGARC
jgi:hypothetical protein